MSKVLKAWEVSLGHLLLGNGNHFSKKQGLGPETMGEKRHQDILQDLFYFPQIVVLLIIILFGHRLGAKLEPFVMW